MDSEVEDEKHDTDPFTTIRRTEGGGLRNPGSRVLHAALIVPFVLVVVLSVTSVSYFAVTNEQIGNLKGLYSGGKCVLFARWHSKSLHLILSSSHACVFSIFGEVAVGVVAALMIVWLVIKAAAGIFAASWIVFCEIPVSLLHMIFAFCVSVTLSIGLAVTCEEYKYPQREGGCPNATLPDPQASSGVKFYDHIRTSMVVSWVVVVLLFAVLAFHILLSIVFCVKCAKKTTLEMPMSEGESSSNEERESDDEPMVPIAELGRR